MNPTSWLLFYLLGVAIATPQEPTTAPTAPTSKALSPMPADSSGCGPDGTGSNCPPSSTAAAHDGHDHGHDHDHDHDHDHSQGQDGHGHDHDHDHDHSHDHSQGQSQGQGQGKEAQAESKTCTPHNGHMHCPPGVAEPTQSPSGATTKPASLTPSGATRSTADVTAGAAAVASLVGAVFVGALIL